VTSRPDQDLDEMVRQLAVEAAGVGVFEWDLATGALIWDDRLLTLFGYDRGSFDGTIEAFNARLHPDDLPRVSRALQEAIDTVGDYTAQYRIRLPDGSVRWIGARGRALAGPDGRAARVLGAAYDTTAHREGETRVAEVLEAMPAAFLSLDEHWRVVYVNAEAERVLGRSRDDLVGLDAWEALPAVRGTVFERNARRAVEERRPANFEAYYPHPLNGWYEVRAWPSRTGLSIYFLEVTERREAQQRVEAAAARAAMLAEVNSELGSTLDAEEAVGRLARLMAPRLADWSLVTLVTTPADGRDWRRGLRDLGWSHAEPEQVELVAGYARTRLESLTDSSPLASALREGRPIVIERDAAARFDASLEPGPAREYMARLAPSSAAVIPLLGRNRTVGLLTLYNGPGRPPLDEQGLATVLDAAARAGLALDNARLYAEQRHLAEELQRSLLTAPPQPAGVRVAVRYEAAAEVAQVGGDWYDAFLQPDGATVVVIGDVVGHDTAAAAAMGQLRGLLRGIAAHTGDGPAAVLRGVDEVLRTLQIEVTATAVVARIEHDGGATRLRWSNAGHPPPMVVGPGGDALVLPGPEADLLLGVDPARPRAEHEFVLAPGATALLYTDGLVERRGQTLDEGLTRLQETLSDLAGLPLEKLCDAVLHRMLPQRLEDDVALVALRLDDQPG
jgi:PAS domain S-box-containing protein